MTDLQRLAEALIDAARAAGAEAADAIVTRATGIEVSVSGGALERAERAESLDLGLRVLVGPRQACVASSDPKPETLAEMAARAVATAREAPEDPYCGLAEPDQTAAEWDVAALEICDPADPPGPEALEAVALALEAAARAVPGVSQVEEASASASREDLAIAASNGFAGAYARTGFSRGVSAIAGQGLGRERDYAAEFRRHAADLPDPAEIGARAGARAVERLAPRKPPAGRYPVLYDERVAGSLIRHLVAALNGASVARGSSWLSDRMGEAVLPDGIDLTEDPLRRRGLASRPFDAEGIRAEPRILVAGGVLRSWVLDLASARQLGLATTGNARRSTGAPPSPGTTNLALSQGGESRVDLIARMGTGLIVTGLIGMSVNPTTGAYSRGASGFWVEGGEIAYPVNEVTVAGSLPEMLRNLTPADDADPTRALICPSLLVAEATVGA